MNLLEKCKLFIVLGSKKNQIKLKNILLILQISQKFLKILKMNRNLSNTHLFNFSLNFTEKFRNLTNLNTKYFKLSKFHRNPFLF